MAQNWETLVTDKRRRLLESIPEDWLITVPNESVLDVTFVPEHCGLLSGRELLITNTTDIGQLLDKLASREWSAVEVTIAFYKRAIIAHQLVNCLTEVFVERALARAAELDDHLKRTGCVVGPLHGLPISLKDQFAIKGIESTMGYASWVGKFAERDSTLVEILYECGAVPFVKTNLPQTLLWVETNNLLFGRTLNPMNRALTSGGSSGGEGALVALKGSPLGVGTDLGGSLRIPAAYNGLYCLKPSSGRMPHQGCATSLDGLASVLPAVGPISASLSGIKLFTQAVLGKKPWLKDPMVVQKKWDETEYALAEHGTGKLLCFAIMWDDGGVLPHPPVARALNMTKSALLAAGHKVIDWKQYKHHEICNLLNGIWRAGSREELLAATAVTGEPLLSSMVVGSQTYGTSFYATGKGISAHQLWQLQKRMSELRKEYLDYWQATMKETGTGRPVDAIICPVAPSAATPHGMTRYTNYTRVWNGLDYVAAVLPVTTVDPKLDPKRPPHKFANSVDQFYYETYDPVKTLAAPIGLQIVGRTLEEEAVLAMTEIVDRALKASLPAKL